MKKMLKAISLALAVALAAVSFTACGTADEGAAKADKVKIIDINLTDEEYAFGVDKDQPELLKQVNEIVKEIKENGKLDEICDKYFGNGTPTAVKSAAKDSSKDQLVVATNASFEPFEYKKGEDYYGIDMEIAQIIAEKLNKELVIDNMKFESVCLSVGQHKCDIAMAGLTVKAEREEYVAFTNSYYAASQKVVVNGSDTKFDDCKTLEDVENILNGFDSSVKIGGQTGTTAQFYVKGDAEWGFDGLKAQWVGYDNGSLAVQDMINGNINYVIIDAAPAASIVKAINLLG